MDLSPRELNDKFVMTLYSPTTTTTTMSIAALALKVVALIVVVEDVLTNLRIPGPAHVVGLRPGDEEGLSIIR